MGDERREVLRRKYLSLGLGELAAAAVFAGGAATSVGPRLDGHAHRALWSALVPLLLVLVEAGVYWLCARSWVGRGPMPAPLAAVYRVLRVATVVGLVAGLVGVVWWWPDDLGPAVLVGGVWVFGVLEYLNYFVIRLAYPLRHWAEEVRQWRQPQLIRDLAAALRGPRTAQPRR